MQLVKFLIYGAGLSHILGAFGLFPFGSSSVAVYVADFLLILSILFFAIWIINTKQNILIPQLFKLIILFWIVGVISLLWSMNYFALNELLGGLYLIRFAIYSMVMLIIYNLGQKSVIKLDSLINLFLTVGLALAVLGFFQYIFFGELERLTEFGFDPHQGRLASSFLDPNFTGAYLILTSSLALYKYLMAKQKNIWLVVLLVLTLAIILTFSRSAYLMLIISGFIFGILKWKKLILVLIIILILSSLLVPRFLDRVKGGLTIDNSAKERFETWRNGLYIFARSPVIGVGFNNLRIAQEQLNLFKPYSQEGGHSGSGISSGIIFILVTTGVVGFIVYLLFWTNLLKHLFVKKTTLSLIIFSLFLGLLVNGQFINSLFFPPIMLWVYSMVGISLCERR